MHNKTIPNGWVDCSLGDVIARVIGGGTPSRAVPAYWVGSNPWASVKDFKDDTQLLHDTEEHISSIGLANSTANLIEAGLPIVCTRMAVGRAALAARPIAINQDLKALYPRPHLDAKYLLLLLTFIRPQLESLSIGSTVKGINVDQLLKIRISFSPLPEQHRIVEIMEAMDEAIAHTEALIAKLKQIKAGLLHDLLTRGLDENGQLRDAITYPEQFKDSPLGRIPKDWKVGKLRDFYAIPARNGLYKPAKFYGQGALMIHMPQMFRGLIIDVSDAARVDVNPSEIERFQLQPGDLVFARRSLNLEGAGRCSLVPNLPETTTYESSIIRVRLYKNKLCPVFANYFLNSETGFRLRLPLIRQVAVSGVSSEDIASISVPCPPQEEQDAITKIIQTHDDRIRTEEAYRDKLKLQKKGLMHDLLTGRVRVNTSQSQELIA